MNLDETLIPYENVAPQVHGGPGVLGCSAHCTALPLASCLHLHLPPSPLHLPTYPISYTPTHPPTHPHPQPGGFQYVLRYSAHSTDVTAVALATKLKLAAVADASGALSLLDLLQPCQLFCTRAMAQPVAQLAFGSHVIPGPKDEPGVERCVGWGGVWAERRHWGLGWPGG